MKKILFVMMAIVALSFASCGAGTANQTESEDTTLVSGDTLELSDSIVTSVEADSTVCPD